MASLTCRPTRRPARRSPPHDRHRHPRYCSLPAASTRPPSTTAPARAWAFAGPASCEQAGWERTHLAGRSLVFDPTVVRVIRMLSATPPGIDTALRASGYQPVFNHRAGSLWVGPAAPR